MKTLFIKRIGAYLLDFIIITSIVSIITMGFNSDSKIKNRINELLIKVTNEQISIEDYSNELFELNYDYQRSILPNTVVSIVVSVGYFILFSTLNKGQTLGKKMFKIEIVNNGNKEPSLLNMLFRSIPLYGILTGIIHVICLNIFDVKIFNYASTIINYVYYGFIIICFFMIIYRKDGRGLHDMIGKTYVREKVK